MGLFVRVLLREYPLDCLTGATWSEEYSLLFCNSLPKGFGGGSGQWIVPGLLGCFLFSCSRTSSVIGAIQFEMRLLIACEYSPTFTRRLALSNFLLNFLSFYPALPNRSNFIKCLKWLKRQKFKMITGTWNFFSEGNFYRTFRIWAHNLKKIFELIRPFLVLSRGLIGSLSNFTKI